MGRPSITVKLAITSKDYDRFKLQKMMTDLRTQELSIVSQMLHLQLALQIGELEQLTIRSKNRCERDQVEFITSSGKNLVPLAKPVE